MIIMEYVNRASVSDLDPGEGVFIQSKFHQYNDRYTITDSPRYTIDYISDIFVTSPGSPLI